MKTSIVRALAEVWIKEAATPEIEDGSPGAEFANAVARGERQAKRECADGLKMLCDLLGDS